MITSTIHPTNGPGHPLSSDLVLTPGGWRSKKKVHLIKSDHYLSGRDGILKELHSETHEIIREFDLIPVIKSKEANLPKNIVVPPVKKTKAIAADQVSLYSSGWITYAGWTNDSGMPITSFSTQWVVPPPPVTESGQTIFLFNGIQNSGFILQPVLQWGSSYAGGRNYWAVANWYVGGPGGDASHSNLVPVNVGDVLTGVMTLTGQNGNLFSYNSNFLNIPDTSLTVADIEELTWANETLEAYSVVSCSNYPKTKKTSMQNIDLQMGNEPIIPQWSSYTPVNDCGQHNQIYPGGRQIDLFYK